MSEIEEKRAEVERQWQKVGKVTQKIQERFNPSGESSMWLTQQLTFYGVYVVQYAEALEAYEDAKRRVG